MRITLPITGNARRFGDRPAIISKYRKLGWAEFAGFVARFAALLREHGVVPGDRVAVLADNCELHLAAFFAIPWAGGILVEINLRLSPVEIAGQIEHSRPKIVLYDEARVELLRQALAVSEFQPAPIAIRGGADSIDERLPNAVPLHDTGRQGSDIASIFYTGGTTGRAKGVMLTHDNHAHNSLAMWAGLGVDPGRIRYLHAPPMFHIADALFVHAVSLLGGLHIILPRFEAEAVIVAIREHEISDVYLVPTMIASLLDALEKNPRVLPSLQRIYYGAMPMPEATLRRLMAVLPHVGPVQLYGQTEAGPVLTMLLPRDHDLSGATAHLRSAGTPMPGTEVKIIGPEGYELPVGEVGEIAACADNVMAGYWQNPWQTAQTIQDGWLRTGDGGYLDTDGYLYVVDRIKDMIISGGENIYSIEVEHAITQHPAVALCAVIGVPDAVWGERVHAVIVLRPAAVLTHDELRAHCRQYIAGYKLPRSTEFRDALPLSGPGKILKRALRDEIIARDALANPATGL